MYFPLVASVDLTGRPLRVLLYLDITVSNEVDVEVRNLVEDIMEDEAYSLLSPEKEAAQRNQNLAWSVCA